MTRSRLGLLGLCAVVFGVMAFSASAAQAEVGANFMVNGSNIAAGLLPQVEVKELENKTASLLFTTTGGTKVEILCTSAKLVNAAGGNATLSIEGKLDLGKATFAGCITKLNGSPSAPCLPHTGATNDVIESKFATGLIVLHSGNPIIEIKSETANFAEIELGEECAIGESVPVKGKLTTKDAVIANGKVELVEHLIEQGPLTELTALGQPATLDGSALIKLAGTHTGLKFSGLPG